MSEPSRTAFSRARSLVRLADDHFDLLVVGGGITGAGVALDAASRGLSVALVDKGDLASGTSSKSSKLVHGGLRYLQQGEIGLVYQALLERQRLLRNAPHLVSGLPFVLPILTKGGLVDRRIARALGLALWQYDLTGGARLGWHRRLDADAVHGLFPGLRSGAVVSGYRYWDAWADDARLTLTLARTAAIDHGAAVATYTAITGVARHDGRVVGATVEADGRTIEVACDAVVNACGVWAEGVQGITGVADAFDIRPAKGVHLSVPFERLPVEAAFVLPVRGDRRSIFVLPWPDGHTYIGTTDTDFDGPLDDPTCTADDITYLLGAVNALTDAELSAGDVTGADIAPPAGVEVHNPDLKIATLSDKGKLEMELVVERGRGYVSAVQNKGADNEIGRMPVDSIYSPVLKVTYKVEATRVEQRTDFDKLVIDVETKPSIRPRDALASAGKTLVELFGLARELNVEAEGIDIGPSPVDEQLAADLALPVEDLQLTVRSYNCLKREGIHTVGELIGRSEQDLLDIRNFGAKSIDEVKAKLVEMGLSLKDSAPGFDPHAALAAYSDDDDDAFVEDEQY